MTAAATKHLLDALSLPTRYEALVESIGEDVARLLVAPERSTLDVIEEAAEAVRSLGEGLFLPLHAASGTGKTTLASNLGGFLPKQFATTLTYEGEVTAASLGAAVKQQRLKQGETDRRVLPVNIDHREGRPATAEELAEIKRFLRQGAGRNTVLLWPTTEASIAEQMAEQSRNISGSVPLELPLHIKGPVPETWPALAKQTLQLANRLDNLDDLISLESYNTGQYDSVGNYLRRSHMTSIARVSQCNEQQSRSSS